jgi:hypothetical protein
MRNAFLRFGKLSYEHIGERRRTSISVTLDRLVAEVEGRDGRQGHAQMFSVLGSDAQIAAISAALAKDVHFIVEAADTAPLRVSMDANPEFFRGAIAVPGRNRSLRHLVAISRYWAASATSANPRHVYLLDSSPEFVWTNLAYIYGLPSRPEWSAWFHQRLVQHEALAPLLGIGCDPVLIEGDRDQFLSWLGDGVAAGEISFPAENGPIVWPNFTLRELLTPQIEAPSPVVPDAN